jgi:uncharacterized iron-regulated membrane protein
MNNRNYNIYFHTHTISGIIISAILFVIFFAGSFAFFKNEISNWQKNIPNNISEKRSVDYNAIFDSLDRRYDLYGRKISLTTNLHSRKLNVSISASKDTLNKTKGGFFYLDPKSFNLEDYTTSYDLGEFLYRLHFLAPVNSILDLGFPLGYYIAGAVAFIFLFALITGLLVHWNKIVSNFYMFRPWEKLKTVWTDLHTALGVISFPFLFIFAVTGAYFLVNAPLFVKPTAALQYEGKQDSLYTDMGVIKKDISFSNQPLNGRVDINSFIDDAYNKWNDADIVYVEAINYGDSSMQLHVRGAVDKSKRFTNRGELEYQVADKTVLKNKHPLSPPSYAEVVDDTLYSLHLGRFGGFSVKVLYFLLGICSCVVIISGVLIWLVARDKPNVPERKRKFNQWLATIYLAICLGMFPVTAIAFIAVKLHPHGGMNFIYNFYFWTWLAVSIALIVRKDIYKINRDCMLAGGIIGLCIPLVSGTVSGNWIWTNYKNNFQDLLLIDLFWLFVSMGALICWRLIVRHNNKKLRLSAQRVEKPVLSTLS